MGLVLVHAVREFSTLADNIGKIKDPVSSNKGWGELPKNFSAALGELDPNKVMRARVLIADLIQHGETHVADL